MKQLHNEHTTFSSFEPSKYPNAPFKFGIDSIVPLGYSLATLSISLHEVFESSVRFTESGIEDTLSGSGASLPKPLAFRQL